MGVNPWWNITHFNWLIETSHNSLLGKHAAQSNTQHEAGIYQRNDSLENDGVFSLSVCVCVCLYASEWERQSGS